MKKDGHSDTFVFVHVNSFWKRINYTSVLVWFWWVVLFWVLVVVLGIFKNVMLLHNLLKVSMVKSGVC